MKEFILNTSDAGLIIINTPMKPTKIAIHVFIETFSFKMNTDNATIMIGAKAPMLWAFAKDKYLKDDFGAYIFEDYNVEDDDGNTVVQQKRKLNPDYDADQAYVSREDRKEWATIGMMGKLCIRKGQPTGNRWIKMRDVSDTVEEWLVR